MFSKKLKTLIRNKCFIQEKAIIFFIKFGTFLLLPIQSITNDYLQRISFSSTLKFLSKYVLIYETSMTQHKHGHSQ